MSFSNKEYELILHFFDETRVPGTLFRNKVQILLSELFGYNRSIFWLADEQGNIYNPEIFNHTDKAMWEYTESFVQHDFLHPKKQLSTISNQKVLRTKDVITLSEYEKSDYYSMFMRKYNYSDEMVIYLMDEGRLRGLIGLSRLKGEKPFDSRDSKRLQYLASHLSHLLSNYAQIEDLHHQRKVLTTHINISTIGMILVDKNRNITFVNETSQNIYKQFNKEINSIDEFLSMYVYSNPNWKSGMKLKTNCQNNKQWTVQVIPKIKGKLSNSSDQYGIYLLSEEAPIKKNLSENILSSREIEICELIIKGYSNEQISEILWISINTVKKHISNIYQKLGINNRTSLAFKLNNFAKAL